MSNDDFDDADTSDFFTIKEHVGDLVIIAVNKFTPSFPTINGERDTIHAEVAIVEGKGVDTRYGEALLFGSKLVPQLRNKIGSTIVASTAPNAKNVTGRTLTSVAAGAPADDEDIPF